MPLTATVDSRPNHAKGGLNHYITLSDGSRAVVWTGARPIEFVGFFPGGHRTGDEVKGYKRIDTLLERYSGTGMVIVRLRDGWLVDTTPSDEA